MTPEAIAAVEVNVKENRRVTMNEIAAHLDMSHGSAKHVIHKEINNILGFHLAHPRILKVHSHKNLC